MNIKNIKKILRLANISESENWAVYGFAEPDYAYALSQILGSSGQVQAVDKNKGKLNAIKVSSLNSAEISLHHKDFTAAKLFDDLDGVLLPYSLHTVKNPIRFFYETMLSIKPNGRLLIIDFNTRRGNPWIKYPIPISRLDWLADKSSVARPKILCKTRHRFGRESYLAEIVIPDLRF